MKTVRGSILVLSSLSAFSCAGSKETAATNLVGAVSYTFESLFEQMTSKTPEMVSARAAGVAEQQRLGAMSFHSLFNYLSETTNNSAYIIGDLSFPNMRQQIVDKEQAFQQLDSSYATVADYTRGLELTEAPAITSLAELQTVLKSTHDLIYNQAPASLDLASSASGCYNGGWFGTQQCQQRGPAQCFTWGIHWFQPECNGAATVCGAAAECSKSQSNPSSQVAKNSKAANSWSNNNNNSGSDDGSGSGNDSGSGSGSGNNSSSSSSGSSTYGACTSQGGKGYGSSWTMNGKKMAKQNADYTGFCVAQ